MLNHQGFLKACRRFKSEEARLVSFFSTCDFPERQAFRDFRIKFFGNPNLTPPD